MGGGCVLPDCGIIDVEQLVCSGQIRLHHARPGAGGAAALADCGHDCAAAVPPPSRARAQGAVEALAVAIVAELCGGADAAVFGGEIHLGRQRHHHRRPGAIADGVCRPFFLPRPRLLVSLAVRPHGFYRCGGTDCRRRRIPSACLAVRWCCWPVCCSVSSCARPRP